jgi:hypothetical protein
MSAQPDTLASFTAQKLLRVQALRLQAGISNNVDGPGSKRSSDVNDSVSTKRQTVEGPTGDGPLYPRIRQLEAELQGKGSELVSMKLQYDQKDTEVRHLKDLVSQKEEDIAKHLNGMADKSRELDELRASKGINMSNMSHPTSLVDIACNMPGFIIEATRESLVGSGMFEGQAKQPALPGKILAQLNPCLVPRYAIIEVARNYKDLYVFLQKNYGAVLPDITLLDTTSKVKRNIVVDFFRVNIAAYTGSDVTEFMDPYVEVAFGMTLCMDTSGMRQYLSDDEMKMEAFKPYMVTDGTRSAEEMAHLSVLGTEVVTTPGQTDDEGDCPPGWRRNTKVSVSGRIYYTYSGPNNVIVNSRKKMMKSAVVYTVPPVQSLPPSSPVPQETEPVEKLTPRLETLTRVQGLTPEQHRGFNSVSQLFHSAEPLSPCLTRTKALFLQLASGGVWNQAKPVVVQPTAALSRVAFKSKAEEEFAKQTSSIVAWREYTCRKFERFMMGDNERDYWQVPAHARESVLMRAYRANAGPSGANLDRSRNMLISFTKYMSQSRIPEDMRWPAGSGLILAFITWRQDKTKSEKLGVSIPADIKASFVRCKLVGMQHQIKLDGAVLYNTCRKGVPVGGSDAAASTSIRMTCHWEDKINSCKHEASLHACICMVLMCHLSLRSVEFKRSKMRKAHFKGARIVNLIVSLSKQGAVDMWAGMHPFGFLGKFDWFEKFDDSMQKYDYIMHAMEWEVGYVGDVSRATMKWGVMADDRMFADIVHWCFLESGLSAACIRENKFTGYSPRHMYTNVAMACQWNSEAEDGCGRWRAAFHAAARDELKRMAERYASDEAMGRQLRLRKCVVVAVTSLVLKYYKFTSLSLMPDFDILCESADFAVSSFRGMLGGAQNIEL